MVGVVWVIWCISLPACSPDSRTLTSFLERISGGAWDKVFADQSIRDASWAKPTLAKCLQPAPPILRFSQPSFTNLPNFAHLEDFDATNFASSIEKTQFLLLLT